MRLTVCEFTLVSFEPLVHAVCYETFLPADSFNKVRGQNHYLRFNPTQNIIPNKTKKNNC